MGSIIASASALDKRVSLKLCDICKWKIHVEEQPRGFDPRGRKYRDGRGNAGIKVNRSDRGEINTKENYLYISIQSLRKYAVKEL